MCVMVVTIWDGLGELHGGEMKKMDHKTTTTENGVFGGALRM